MLKGSLAAKLVLVLSGGERRRGLVPRLMLLGQPLLHRDVSILCKVRGRSHGRWSRVVDCDSWGAGWCVGWAVEQLIQVEVLRAIGWAS